MGKQWDGSKVSFSPTVWAEVLRVLKPGGHLLAFGGSRTYHRITCAIEDAGFEIRDQIMWIYGSGFPKSLDVSKAIDKAAGAEREVVGTKPKTGGGRARPSHEGWQRPWMQEEGALEKPFQVTAPVTNQAKQFSGFGTAIKPAHEPLVVARKPLSEKTVAANVLNYGTGALNIDGCRISSPEGEAPFSYPNGPGGFYSKEYQRTSPIAQQWNAFSTKEDNQPSEGNPQGRWPANVIHDGSDEVVEAFPTAPGQLANASASAPSEISKNCYGKRNRVGEASADRRYTENGSTNFAATPGQRRFDSGSAARFFKSCSFEPGEEESAHRFFYCAKASKKERGEGNDWPTVKPIALMRFLCRLVTPPGGLVLDPFLGSGTTGLAALEEGFRFEGIDSDQHAIDIACSRFTHYLDGKKEAAS